MLAAIGNTKFNRLYEGELPSHSPLKPDPKTPREQKEQFIRDKYVHKKWLSQELTRRHAAITSAVPTPTAAAGSSGGSSSGSGSGSGGGAPGGPALDEKQLELIDAAFTDDIEAMLCLLAVSVDVNWQNPADANRTALHKAAENDSILCCTCVCCCNQLLLLLLPLLFNPSL